MRTGVKTLLVFSLWFLILLGGYKAFGGDAEIAPPDSYELRFLGVKLKKDINSRNHPGLFLFIWKGDKPTKVLGYGFGEKPFAPFASFGVHNASGWKPIGEWCGTGTSWITVQPGQVITFSMDMGWVERDMPGYPSLKDADKARLNFSSKDGGMVSDEFPLPLTSATTK
jgi:hypothetical protein